MSSKRASKAVNGSYGKLPADAAAGAGSDAAAARRAAAMMAIAEGARVHTRDPLLRGFFGAPMSETELRCRVVHTLTSQLDGGSPELVLTVLHQLSAGLSPPERQSVVLDQPAAAAIVDALRGLQPQALPAAVAVPLVFALLKYDFDLPSEKQVETNHILPVCIPHTAALVGWHVDNPLRMHPTGRRLQCQRVIARLVYAAAQCLGDPATGRRLLGARNLQLLPEPGWLAQAAADVAASAAVAACEQLQTARAQDLQHDDSSDFVVAFAAARLAMLAVNKAADAAGSLPRQAALPMAMVFHTLLQMLERTKNAAAMVVENAPLLEGVAEMLPARPLRELQRQAAAAASAALAQAEKMQELCDAAVAADVAQAESAEPQHSGPGSGRSGASKPDGSQRKGSSRPSGGSKGGNKPGATPAVEQALTEAMSVLLPRMVAATHVLATVSQVPHAAAAAAAAAAAIAAAAAADAQSAARAHLLSRLLRWALQQLQQEQPLLREPAEVRLGPYGDDRPQLLGDQVLAIADSATSGLAALLLTAIGQDLASRSSRGQATPGSRGQDSASAAAGITPVRLATLAAAVEALTDAIMVLGSRHYMDRPPDLWAASNALVAITGWAADILAHGDHGDGGSSAGMSTSGGAGDSGRPGTAARQGAAAVLQQQQQQQQPPPPTASAAGTAAAGTAAAVTAGTAAGATADGALALLLSHAVSGLVAVGGWAMLMLASTAAGSRPAGATDASERLAKAEAQMRAARLTAAAAGVPCDLCASAEGRAALKTRSGDVAHIIAASLMVACETRGMHSNPTAAAELCQLLHDAAAALPDLLTPQQVAEKYLHKMWQQATATVRKSVPGVGTSQLQQAIAALSNVLCGGGSTSGSGGTHPLLPAAAAHTEAAAEAAATALLQEEADAASSAKPAAVGQQAKAQRKKGPGSRKR